MTLFHNPAIVKLGRAAHDIEHYLKLPKWAHLKTTATAPISAPPTCDWTLKAGIFPMDLNDSLGDCTIASCAHLTQVWTCNEIGGQAVILSDTDVLAAYKACSGYNGTPATDVGCMEINVLNYWQTTGIGGRKITNYVTLDITKQQEIMETVALFGGAYIGVNLPVSAQT